MAKKKSNEKYGSLISFRINNELLNRLDQKAKNRRMTRTDLILELIEMILFNELEYCRNKAKKFNHDFHYWKSRAEAKELEYKDKGIKIKTQWMD